MLTSLTCPFNVQVVRMRVLETAMRIPPDEWARSTMSNTPDLTVPDHVVYPGRTRGPDQFVKQEITDESFIRIIGAKPNVQSTALRMCRLDAGSVNIPANVDAQVLGLGQVGMNECYCVPWSGLILVPPYILRRHRGSSLDEGAANRGRKCPNLLP